MPDWLARIIQQWEVVVTAPVPFLTVIAAVLILIWLVISYAYQSRLASRDGEVSLLVRQRDDYKEKLGGASPDEAKTRIDKLEAQIKALTPRRLTDDQKTRLTALLARLPGSIEIVFDLSVADARGLAGDLIAAFNSADWHTQTPTILGPWNLPPHGIGLVVPDPCSLTPRQALIFESLDATGVQFDMQRGDPGHPGNSGTLFDACILVTHPSPC